MVGGPETEVPNAPKAGEVFAGKYRVDRMLGVGGMGFVFAAHAEQERVAIKMLLPQLAKNGEVVARFLREGRAASQIRSEHGVRVIEAASLPDGTPFLVMEYLDGTDLQSVLATRGKLPVTEAVDWMLQACEALAEAHKARTVHRDLKPSNLFLAQTSTGPVIKVLDFGISKSIATDVPSMHMTRTSAMMGTPLYMSPEQLKSARDVDERADVWSIGVILFELLTGRPPFDAASLPELSVLVLAGKAPRLAGPDIPPGLADVVATCLRPAREERFANLAELAHAIAPFGSAGARDSARNIIATLGAPKERASSDPLPRASSDSFPHLAATVPLAPSPVASAVASPSSDALSPATKTLGTFGDAPLPLASRKGLAVAAAAFVIAGIAGAALIVASIGQRAPHAGNGGLVATSTATASPPPAVSSEPLPAPEAPAPSASIPPAATSSVHAIASAKPSTTTKPPAVTAKPKPKRPSAFDTEN